MSWVKDEWNKVTGGISDEWHKFTDWATGVKNKVVSTVQGGVDTVTGMASDAEQRAADAYNDAKHPVYSAIETGLTAIFGKQAMKWLVDTLLGFFGKKGEGNVQSFGSGEFTETLERWQRELNRDLGVKPLTASASATVSAKPA